MSYYRHRSSRYANTWEHPERLRISYDNSLQAQVDARRYVRQKFFSMDRNSFNDVVGSYEGIYGAAAAAYLRSTYASWKHGSVKMAKRTEQRILETVPKHLSIEDQYELLVISSTSLKELARPKYDATRSARSADDIVALYRKAIQAVDRSSEKLSWFVDALFAKEEIDEYNACLRYIAKNWYVHCCNALLAEIDNLTPLATAKGCKVTWSFQDLVVGFSVPHWTDGRSSGRTSLDVDLTPPTLVSRFGAHNTNHLVQRILDQTRVIETGQIKSLLGVSDVANTINIIASAPSMIEIDERLKVEATSGVFNIEIRRINVLLRKEEAERLASQMTVGGYLGGVLALLLLAVEHALLAAVVGAVTAYAVYRQKDKITIINNEVREYE